MIGWGQEIEFIINANVNYSRTAILDAFKLWEDVANVDFVETTDPSSADFIIADLSEVKDAFGLLPEADGLNVTVTDDLSGAGVKSYIGLDQSEITSFDLIRIAAHEIGHAFGFTDRPSADPDQTIFSYVSSGAAHLEADDIEAIQEWRGASPNDNVIHAGDGSGTVSGGAGNDTIFGDGGSDLIYGNQGNDILYGNRGNDRLHGGQGDDVLYGGAGDDVFVASKGSDTVIGGEGYDILKIYAPPSEVTDTLVVGDGYHVELSGIEKVQYGGLEWIL